MAGIIFGSEYEFLSGGRAQFMSLANPSSSGFVVTFREGFDPFHGTSKVGTVSGTVITFGSETEFRTGFGGARETDTASIDVDKFVVGYRSFPDVDAGVARVGDVSGTTITYGSEYEFQNLTTELALAVLTTSGFVAAYEDPTVLGGSPDSFVKVGDVSGNVITYGSGYSFLDGAGVGIDHVEIVSQNPSGFVVIYNRTLPQGRMKVGSISGTTISYGSEYDFSDGGADHFAAAMLDSTRFVIAYQDSSDSDVGKARIVTVADTTLTFGPQFEFASSGTDDKLAITAMNDHEFIVGYMDTGDSNGIKVRVGTAYRDTIVFGTPTLLKGSSGISSPIYIDITMLDETMFAVAWRDALDSDHGTAKIGQAPVTSNMDMFLQVPEPMIASGDLYISGILLSESSVDLYVQGPLLESGEFDLFVSTHETHNNDIPLYIISSTLSQASGNLFISGPELETNFINLSIFAPPPDVIKGITLFLEGPLSETLNAFSDLFIEGHLVDSTSGDLFVHGHNIFQASGDLYMSGSVATITDNIDLFISGPTPSSGDIDLFIRGVSVLIPSSGDEGRAMDWFLRTSDHFPQLIGTFEPDISGVTIQVWDIIDGNNVSLPLVDIECYSINDTGRWGWSTANLPEISGGMNQYYYAMTGDPSGTFDGQFFLEVPEDAKWAHPNSRNTYLI